MYSKNQEYIPNNYQEKNNRKNENGNKSLKQIKNYNTQKMKRGTYEAPHSTEQYFTDHSYDNTKQNQRNSYYQKNKKSSQEDNVINNKQNINYKNKYNKIQPDYKINSNDIMRINSITFFSEEYDNNKGRSISSTKINKKIEDTLNVNNQNHSRIEDKRIKNMNRVELDNNSKNNSNSIFINSNENTPLKIINKIKSNFPYSNTHDENGEKLIKNNRRKNKNKTYIFDHSINNNYLNDNILNEKENKLSKYSTKINNNNRLIKMIRFEISYESDKGERNTYNSYKKNRNNIINNNSNYNQNHNFKYNNIYYSNINLEESNKNNYNSNNNTIDNNELYNNLYSTKSKTNNPKNYQYKYQIIHNNSTSNNNNLINIGKKKININDSVEIKDLYNNKSVSIVSISKKNNIKSNTNTSNNSRPLKSNKSNVTKNSENKIIISNYNNRNNKSIDVINQNKLIKKNDINTNMSIENPIIITNESQFNKKNSDSSFTTNQNCNSSRMKKKKGNNFSKKIQFKSYHRQSDIKKIILIQAVYRSHLLNMKLNEILKIFNYYKELFQLIFSLFIERKRKYWKLFLNKIIKKSTNKLINKTKNIKNPLKNKNISNGIITTNNKLILKANEINILNKELGDSFNIINDNNCLKLKLDDMIKENNKLKNQIFDNKNIEKRLKQLLIENKKNQNINEIIMKDNQQLAKRLKNIQDNRNNQLVIQNQKSFDLATQDNLQFQSVPKLKYLYLKCLVFKKILKNRNILKIYFNKYRYNIKKKKTFKIENNNISINNRKKINIQMAKNFNINFISQNDNNKHFILYKLFLKKEKEKIELFSRFFYKYFYIMKYMKLFEEVENMQKEKEFEVIKDKNEQKKNLLQSIIDKYERNYDFLSRQTFREWKLRTVIFKMKGVAKEIKKKKKLKKKIREKIAKETLNNLKNKTAMFQSAHEFSYKIDKTDKKDKKSPINKILKTEDNKLKEKNNIIKEEKEKIIEDQEDSEDSFRLDV